VNFLLYPIYVRGEAFLTAHQGTAAATEFQKILDHPGLVLNQPIAAPAHLELGRAYAPSGDNQGFLALSKNAHPDIPILKHKAEYEKLK